MEPADARGRFAWAAQHGPGTPGRHLGAETAQMLLRLGARLFWFGGPG
jgi:hypothetical protein